MNHRYLSTLTWLRAFAAFFVVISHSIGASEVAYAPQDEASFSLPLNFLDLGTFGVYLFFALSGCTLYISNAGKVKKSSDLLPFFIKRFFRIWPAFAISLLIYIPFIEIFRYFYSSDTSFWIAQFLKDYTWLDVLRYLSLTFNITGPNGLFVGPYWSLPIEFQYYILLAPALLLMRNKWLDFLVPLLFGAFLYLFYLKQTFNFDRGEFFKMGFVFFGGVMLGKYRDVIKWKIPFDISCLIFLFIILLTGALRTKTIIIPDRIPFINDIWNAYGLISLISVALALMTNEPRSKSKMLDFIHEYGTISYSIYLFHMLVLGVVVLITIKYEIYGDNKKQLFILIFTLLFSYLISKLTYKYIEEPSIDVGRKVSRI